MFNFASIDVGFNQKDLSVKAELYKLSQSYSITDKNLTVKVKVKMANGLRFQPRRVFLKGFIGCCSFFFNPLSTKVIDVQCILGTCSYMLCNFFLRTQTVSSIVRPIIYFFIPSCVMSH